jgi:hypothetical protein
MLKLRLVLVSPSSSRFVVIMKHFHQTLIVWKEAHVVVGSSLAERERVVRTLCSHSRGHYMP